MQELNYRKLSAFYFVISKNKPICWEISKSGELAGQFSSLVLIVKLFTSVSFISWSLECIHCEMDVVWWVQNCTKLQNTTNKHTHTHVKTQFTCLPKLAQSWCADIVGETDELLRHFLDNYVI